MIATTIILGKVDHTMSGDGAHKGNAGSAKSRGSGKATQKKSDATPEGERIAKALSRAGVASRREAERMIEAGRVAVNGERLKSPARNVTPEDVITVDNREIEAKQRTRVFRYHKPRGVVTTARDERGRTTIYDVLPEGLPRLMPVGRLDITSEGLLLLTNDGEVKRKLELPSTGWLRKYRVRVHGDPTDAKLKKLEKGVVIEGERFQPMMVTVDRVQGANAWLTVGLREGRNREIRRAMESVGLDVNRLIRTSYGPFRLGTLPEGAVEEAPTRVLNDHLGLSLETPAAVEKRERREAAERAASAGETAEESDEGPGKEAAMRAARKNAESATRESPESGSDAKAADGAGNGKGEPRPAPSKRVFRQARAAARRSRSD